MSKNDYSMNTAIDIFTPGQQHPPFPKRRLLALFLLAWLSLCAGINTIPIEQHEAYVLQTSREMSVTNDWVLPYFSAEPRLNKPPLNYWLTLGISFLDPFSNDIEPWHGRIWSMLGALLLVLMTAFMGNKLYGEPAGFLASAFLLASKGFTVFSHDARPDLLYSALCVLQLFAWITAWREQDDSRAQRMNAALGWLLAGLATLAKGPQVPTVFLLGFLLFLFFGGERKRALKILRPFSGLLIWLSLCLPWWLLLQERVKMLGVIIGKTQLSGSLLATSSVKEILSFFYVSRLLDFLLPVSLLLPLLFFLNRKSFGRPDESDRLFLYTMFIFLAVFTVAGHQRSRYMLPLLPLSALLLAGVASRTTCDCIPDKVWQMLIRLEASALVVFPVLFIIQQQYATGLLLICTGFLSILLLKKELREPVWLGQPFAAKLLAGFLLVPFIFAGYHAYSIRNDRLWNRDFSLSVGNILNSGDLLMAWGNYPAVLPYYARHSVVSVNGFNELENFYAKKGTGQNFYLLVQQSELAAVKKVFEIATLSSVGIDENPDKKMIFVKILDMHLYEHGI